MAETLGLTTAYDVWCSLQLAYRQDSQERMQNLKDNLRQLQNGSSTVSEFSATFKSLCDQLTSIGHPVNELDKIQWFLCGLGVSFETFSTTHRAIKPPPLFRDLVSQAESHELFLKSIHGSTTPVVAFTINHQQSYGSRGGNSTSRVRGRGS